MTNRSIIRLFSYSICVVAVLAAYAVIGNSQSAAYKTRLEASYQQSLTELSECLDSIETNLTKSAYASTSTMMATLSEDLYSECNTAKNALSHLPIEQMNLSGAYKFLSQAGDYANYLSVKTKNGTQISEEEYKNLLKLLDYAKKYSESVNSMVSKCSAGGKITDNEVESNGSGTKVASISLDFTQAEETFSDYPTLLYDGPFADAVLNKKPEMIKNAPEVSKEDCQKIAAQAFNVGTDLVTFKTEEYGTIECYNFAYKNNIVSITKKGGYVAYILGADTVNSQTISQENAVNIAASYLKNLGYNSMVNTYYAVSNNICVVNFAYSQNGIIYYSDLIKVGISMSDGKVYSLEAEGYLTNHCERRNYAVNISESDAKARLTSHIELISSKLCIIPKDNGIEVQCYEFHCRSKESGDEVLIYVNTESGEEENILMLLYSDNGTLTK